MTLTVSSDLKIYKSFQKATRFSKDRDFVIHARLCRLCPAPWTLLQIHPERKVDIKHSGLFSTSHLGDSGLTPFKLALVILGHQFSQITAQVLWMSSLSAKSTSPHPCQHSEVLVAVSHGLLTVWQSRGPLGNVSSKLPRPAAPQSPSTRGLFCLAARSRHSS